MAEPRLSIIVVSYNTREMTLDCLRSIVTETETPYELIVVDNASGDGSAEAIAAEFPDLDLMAETKNHGFARANNLAVARARGEYILLLNPDTVVHDRALDRLLAYAETTPAARIWGGRTIYADGRLNPYSCWRRMTLWNIFCRTSGLAALFPGSAIFNAEAYGGWDRGNAAPVDIVTGCLFLIRRADWQTLGGFDPAFIMYGEEADLCFRAMRELGAQPHITPEATIVHYGAASERVQADKMVRILRAKMELIRRHFPSWQRAPASALFRLWPLSRRWVAGLVPGRRTSADAWREIWARRAEWERGFD